MPPPTCALPSWLDRPDYMYRAKAGPWELPITFSLPDWQFVCCQGRRVSETTSRLYSSPYGVYHIVAPRGWPSRFSAAHSEDPIRPTSENEPQLKLEKGCSYVYCRYALDLDGIVEGGGVAFRGPEPQWSLGWHPEACLGPWITRLTSPQEGRYAVVTWRFLYSISSFYMPGASSGIKGWVCIRRLDRDGLALEYIFNGGLRPYVLRRKA